MIEVFSKILLRIYKTNYGVFEVRIFIFFDKLMKRTKEQKWTLFKPFDMN